jgi:hypothetical protein
VRNWIFAWNEKKVTTNYKLKTLTNTKKITNSSQISNIFINLLAETTLPAFFSSLDILHLRPMTTSYLLHGAESFLGSQPVNFAASQEIPRIYGTRKFLTAPTSARHLSLS